jgi:hypothetical protein
MTTEKSPSVYDKCADLGLLHGLTAGPDAEFTDENTAQVLREYWESDDIDMGMRESYDLQFFHAWPFADDFAVRSGWRG